MLVINSGYYCWLFNCSWVVINFLGCDVPNWIQETDTSCDRQLTSWFQYWNTDTEITHKVNGQNALCWRDRHQLVCMDDWWERQTNAITRTKLSEQTILTRTWGEQEVYLLLSLIILTAVLVGIGGTGEQRKGGARKKQWRCEVSD